jgi:hypothetical protein
MVGAPSAPLPGPTLHWCAWRTLLFRVLRKSYQKWNAVVQYAPLRHARQSHDKLPTNRDYTEFYLVKCQFCVEDMKNCTNN